MIVEFYESGIIIHGCMNAHHDEKEWSKLCHYREKGNCRGCYFSNTRYGDGTGEVVRTVTFIESRHLLFFEELC